MLQVIVTDHAGLTVFAGIRHVTVVERWRRGRKLIPWHWDSEALEGLNGKAADWALEDLADTVLKPALATALRLEGLSDSMRLQINLATFKHQSIDFEAIVTVAPASMTDEETPRPSVETTVLTVRGSVLSDLSVSIAVPPSP